MLWNSNIKVIHRDENTVIVNAIGKWIRIPKAFFSALDIAISNATTLDKLLAKLADNEDREDMKRIMQVLENMNSLHIKPDSTDQPNPAKRLYYFELTNHCNLQCGHCAVNASHNSKICDLPFSIIREQLDKLAKTDPATLCFTGGEPLMREDIFQLGEYIKSHSSHDLALMTNGTLIKHENVKDIVRIFDSVDMSIDGVDEESCSKVRGKGVFQKVINAIELLHQEGLQSISLSMVLTKDNYKLQDEFNLLCENLGVAPILRIYEAVGRGHTNQKKYIPPKNALNVKDIGNSEERTPELGYRPSACTCAAGKKILYIKPDGRIFPCQSLDQNEFCMGNILDIEDINAYFESVVYSTALNKIDALLIPEKEHPCATCDVKSFCWGCPGLLYRWKKTPAISHRCQINRDALMKSVWGEELNTNDNRINSYAR